MKAGWLEKKKKTTRRAFCRNINFPFFTLMLHVAKIENQKKARERNNMKKGESGKFKGSTFFFALTTFVGAYLVLYWMKKKFMFVHYL
jgi:hypothetical protein